MNARAAAAVMTILVTASIIATPATAQSKADTHVYGAEPGWAQFREIAEAAVIARLIDPESARITWMSGYRKGGFKPFLQGRVFGYAACGQVNARNRMGGYTGATTFVVVVDNGRALFVDLDSGPGGLYADMCAKQIANGLMPPVPPGGTDTAAVGTTTAGTPSQATMSATGLTVRAMPEGAYVSSVRPGSLAASAGLAPGMVITSINAIPLAGMGDALIKVVAAAGPGATLTLVGGKSLTLRAEK